VINPTTATRTYTDIGKYKATGQPSFSVYMANALTNVTGDGTVYQIVFDTEEFDTDNNVTLAGTTFLTPVAGKYRYTLNILITNIDVAHTTCNLNIVTSAGLTFQCNPAAIQNSTNAATIAVSGIDIAGAGESIVCNLTVSGGAKQIGIAAGANFSYWDCSLIC
jgi:NADPH-dependent curcumin reductase CurA